MESILVPTDFSECADNALEYALHLAAQTGAAVTILNVYHVPLPAGEVPLMLVSPHEILEKTNDRLRELVSAAKIAYSSRFDVTGITREGFAADEIVETAHGLNADCVVMGTQGSTSAIGTLLGSVATAVIKRSKSPVLVIPASVRYTPIRKIVYAFDYSNEPGERTADILKKYSRLLNAELQIVNIVTPEKTPAEKVLAAASGLENAFADTQYRLYFREGEEVISELAGFISEHKSDWLVVVPHEYGFFHSLYHRSISKQAAMRMEIPTLSIHE
jgi:nucleotide-binding universal stress UspA family protein